MLVRLKKIAAIRAALEDCVETLPEVDCLRARVLWIVMNFYELSIYWNSNRDESFIMKLKPLKRFRPRLFLELTADIYADNS